ncbi:MAG: zf-HC2 domain-containing protein [Anaerolineae bacterium]|nr:zf-HC2 domain-containing protein [Anaerolineae bacterium]
MNCQGASLLLDDYREGTLSQREAHSLELHLASCPRCAADLHLQPALDRDVRRTLAASVQSLTLTPEMSAQIVCAAEDSLRKGRRTRRVLRAVQSAVMVVGLAFLCVGLYFLAGGNPRASGTPLVSQLPASSLPFSSSHDSVIAPQGRSPSPLPEPADQTLPSASLVFEPWVMHPNDPYTMTLFFQSDQAVEIDSLRVELDVDGPTGYYRFDLEVEGPLPGRGVSILRVTPDVLEKRCQEQYLISANEVFRDEGTYNVRMTLSDAVTLPSR